MMLFFIPLSFMLLGLLLFSAVRVSWQREKSDAKTAEIEKNISTLELKNHELREFVDYLHSEDFLRRQAKNTLGLKVPGEEVLVITDLPKIFQQPSSFSAPSLGQEQKSNLVLWWEYFFGQR